jgi:hypothetical protein
MGYSYAPVKAKFEIDSDAVVVDFESATLPAGGYLVIGAEGYEEDGFVFKATPGIQPDSIIGTSESGSIIPSAIDAIAKLNALAVGSKPNQALAPNYFSEDIIVTYQELDDSGVKEQEDFRFKGAYLFEVTFTAYRDGELVGQTTTMATSGAFVKSGIKGKIDTLIISDNNENVDLWIDNAVFDI